VDLEVLFTIWKSTNILDSAGPQTQILRRPSPSLFQELQDCDHGVWLTDAISFFLSFFLFFFFGLCPSSKTFKNHDISEANSASIFR